MQSLEESSSTSLTTEFVFTDKQEPSALHSLNHILTADSVSQLIDRVTELYQHTPAPEHSVLAAKVREDNV